jgi:hypothetical protein
MILLDSFQVKLVSVHGFCQWLFLIILSLHQFQVKFVNVRNLHGWIFLPILILMDPFQVKLVDVQTLSL